MRENNCVSVGLNPQERLSQLISKEGEINVDERDYRDQVLELVTKGVSKFKMGSQTIWLAMCYYDLCTQRALIDALPT